MGRIEGIERGCYIIRQYKYADKDIKQLTGSIVVLADAREKQNRHITDYFDKNHIAYEPATLSYGDYSFLYSGRCSRRGYIFP